MQWCRVLRTWIMVSFGRSLALISDGQSQRGSNKLMGWPGIGTSAGRCLRQIYGPCRAQHLLEKVKEVEEGFFLTQARADVSLPPPPARADQGRKHCSSAHLQLSDPNGRGLPQVHRSSINLHKIRGAAIMPCSITVTSAGICSLPPMQ